jgi:hypothetical protein
VDLDTASTERLARPEVGLDCLELPGRVAELAENPEMEAVTRTDVEDGAIGWNPGAPLKQAALLDPTAEGIGEPVLLWAELVGVIAVGIDGAELGAGRPRVEEEGITPCTARHGEGVVAGVVLEVGPAGDLTGMVAGATNGARRIDELH